MLILVLSAWCSNRRGVTTFKAWLEVMDTAVVYAAVAYMLLKQCYGDKLMLFEKIG